VTELKVQAALSETNKRDLQAHQLRHPKL